VDGLEYFEFYYHFIFLSVSAGLISFHTLGRVAPRGI
jgi:hypothetical protein